MTESAPSPGSEGVRKGRVALGIAAFAVVVSLAAVIAAVWYFGGTDAVLSSFSIGLKKPSKPAIVATPTPEATPASTEFGKRMYIEQLESHEVIGRMADGEVSSLVVRKVEQKGDVAQLDVIATFVDGTYANGVMVLERNQGQWYLFSLTGLRDGDAEGLSSAVAEQTGIEASATLDAELDALGMSTFDGGVIDTMVSEQAANQDVLKNVLNGTYNAIETQRPAVGAGTIAIPIILTGPKDRRDEGSLTLILKDIDGAERTFITAMQ